jgi:hypothetical protein
MTCRDAHHWIRCHRLFADGLEEAESAALAEHLLACPSCTEFMDQEEALDAQIQPVMLAVPIPRDLSQRILWNLRRARRTRQRAVTLYASLAAAAALFLAVCLGWYIQRPYDLAGLQESGQLIAQGQVLAKFDPPSQGRESALTAWLQHYGIAAVQPAQLKLQYLTAAYVLESGGRKIAMLELNTPGSASRVYLLQRRYFNEKQRLELEQEGVISKLVADADDSPFLGWMVIDKGTALDFLDDALPQNGT